jgi:hypothetical protein
VIARGNDIYFYIKGNFLQHIAPDPKLNGILQAGQIGVTAFAFTSSQSDVGPFTPTIPTPDYTTDVAFSDLKVWDLGNS